MPSPNISLQTGTLYASGADSTFTGTGGPWGFSPFTSEFAGVVSSAGLLAEPFADTVYQVATGDEVIFVIAVQNLGPAAVYDLRLRSSLPTGFLVPPDYNLSVTNGSSTDIGFTGNLFSTAGLQVTAPVAAYDPDNGNNVVLVTYTLGASAALPGPEVDVPSTVTLLNAASTSGGPNLVPATSATTDVITATPTVTVIAEGNPQSLAIGQTVTYDVTVAFPTGSVAGLTLDTILPGGGAHFDFVSASLLSLGSGLTANAPTVGANGHIQFGTVTAAAGGADTLTARVVLKADGSTGGTAIAQAVVGSASGWSTEVDSSIAVVASPPAPTMSGFWTAQHATTTMSVHPLGGLTLGGNPAQTGTLAITLQDGSAGAFSTAGIGTIDSTGRTWLASGTFAQLQSAARALLFSPSATGTVLVDTTLVDSNGGTAQDASTAITVEAPAARSATLTHGAVQPGTSFHTATSDGQQTTASGQQYTGPVDYLTTQYVYDGTGAVSVVADSPNAFIVNLAGTAAITLNGGRNVVDAGIGSNYITGGSGDDTFFLDSRGGQTTWNTLVNFHPGDIATVWGYTPGMATHWDDWAGAPGSEGRTLRIDTRGDGSNAASLTFAGATQAVTDTYAFTSGRISGIDYMEIFALPTSH